MPWIAGHPQVQAAGDGAGEERLAGAGDVLEQDVAVREQRDGDQPQRLVRADHRPCDRAAQVVPQPAAGAGHVDTGRAAAGAGGLGLGGAWARARRRRGRPPWIGGSCAVCGFAGLSEAYRPERPAGSAVVATGPQPGRAYRVALAPRSTALEGHARVAAVARPYPRPARFHPRPRRGVQGRPAHGQDQPELGRVRGRDRHDPGPADGHRGRAPPGRSRGDEALPADRRRGRLSRARACAGPGRRPRGRDLRAGARDPDAGRHRAACGSRRTCCARPGRARRCG